MNNVPGAGPTLLRFLRRSLQLLPSICPTTAMPRKCPLRVAWVVSCLFLEAIFPKAEFLMSNSTCTFILMLRDYHSESSSPSPAMRRSASSKPDVIANTGVIILRYFFWGGNKWGLSIPSPCNAVTVSERECLFTCSPTLSISPPGSCLLVSGRLSSPDEQERAFIVFWLLTICHLHWTNFFPIHCYSPTLWCP